MAGTLRPENPFGPPVCAIVQWEMPQSIQNVDCFSVCWILQGAGFLFAMCWFFICKPFVGGGVPNAVSGCSVSLLQRCLLHHIS